ncbi:cupin domain-containing protein [Pseudomonas luteola]|uniref:cupin domain-containing protein n=1 Tax=Pseudomonas TaxID=286 RepID=UPI00388F4264
MSRPENDFASLCPSGDGPLTTIRVGSHYRTSAQVTWQPCIGAPGFWIKPLYCDDRHGERSFLMRVDPGAVATLHSHPTEFEQLFVVEGTFYDQNQTMVAGDYCCRAPGAKHTGGSENGAVLFVTYTSR